MLEENVCEVLQSGLGLLCTWTLHRGAKQDRTCHYDLAPELSIVRLGQGITWAHSPRPGRRNAAKIPEEN